MPIFPEALLSKAAIPKGQRVEMSIKTYKKYDHIYTVYIYIILFINKKALSTPSHMGKFYLSIIFIIIQLIKKLCNSVSGGPLPYI